MEGKFATGRILALIGGVVLLLCFFLPWYGPITGYDGARSSPLLWLCPVAGLAIILAMILSLHHEDSFVRNAGTVVLLLGILGVIPALYEFVRSQQWATLASALTGASWTVGFWGTLLACIIAVFGGVLIYAAPQEQGGVVVIDKTERVVVEKPVTSQPRPVPQDKTEFLGAQAPALAWLAVKSGERAGQQQWGLQAVTNIGRDGATCQVVFQDSAVSKQHARINLEGGQFVIYDLASTNGTFVNNRRIQKQLLYDNDVIGIGHNQLVFKRA